MIKPSFELKFFLFLLYLRFNKREIAYFMVNEKIITYILIRVFERRVIGVSGLLIIILFDFPRVKFHEKSENFDHECF